MTSRVSSCQSDAFLAVDSTGFGGALQQMRRRRIGGGTVANGKGPLQRNPFSARRAAPEANVGALDTGRQPCYPSITGVMPGEELGTRRGGRIEWNDAAARHGQRVLSAQSKQIDTIFEIPVESSASTFFRCSCFSPTFSTTRPAEQDPDVRRRLFRRAGDSGARPSDLPHCVGRGEAESDDGSRQRNTYEDRDRPEASVPLPGVQGRR